MKRKGIRLKIDQIWGIGNGTIKKVSEINEGLTIGDKVKIIRFHGCGLIGVQCTTTGEQFDITSHSLTNLI